MGMKPMIFGRSTGKDIHEIIASIVSEWRGRPFNEISDYIASITVDNEKATTNAANMVMGDGEEDRCFAHTLQLCIKDATNPPKDCCKTSIVYEMGTFLTKIRSQCATLRCSKAGELLRTSSLDTRHASVILPSPTRWSGDFYMMERYAEMAHVLQALSDAKQFEKGDWGLTDRERQLMHTYIDVMRPFEEITTEAEGDKLPSLAHVPRWVYKLKQTLTSQEGENQAHRSFKQALQQSVENRLNQYLECRHDPTGGAPLVSTALCAAAVHPDHWTLFFVTEEMRQMIWERIEVDSLQQLDRFSRSHESARQLIGAPIVRSRIKAFDVEWKDLLNS